MTNLLPSGRRQWITRGRVLVGLPIIFGVIVSACLFLIVLRPVWQDAKELERRRDSLLQLQRNLPVMEGQLESASFALEQAQQQQDLLIGFLAGRDKVQTFLALLNQQAVLSDVKILRYEPLAPVVASAQQPQAQDQNQKGDESLEPTDPLLALGYQKSSVALAVRGPYDGLHAFLQKMEALELLVESSNLEITAVEIETSDEDSDPQQPTTQLTLQLNFYDIQTGASPIMGQSVAKLPV
ncbi:hypothetical protein KR52_03605 [Synechococcus sp. KORDI-52]|uniref:hypothetical protein n=1 Tax=Synechococcus sp. KORDI-52 TaxID=585425 RepID=UPI0004E0542F|nr:hypothetical protein [Synechococcus sp. KORDI-52]AII48241.1 hypothetical protein KR52_03605 [Synechococcus sp. KORDI-52]